MWILKELRTFSVSENVTGSRAMILKELEELLGGSASVAQHG